MTTEQVNTTPATAETKRRARSPAYPAIDLEEALQRAEGIRKAEGRNLTHLEVALGHWGMKPKSGAGFGIVSALMKFGLMEDEGSGATRRVKLSPLAFKILLDDRPDSIERSAAIKEAALLPAIHRELWDKYQGSLPSDLTLRHYLRAERGFEDAAADKLVRELRSTIAYAKLSSSDKMAPQAEDKIEPDGELKMAPLPEIKETPVRMPADLKRTPPLATTTKTLQIPLTDAPWAMLQVSYPMSAEAYKELMDTLNQWASRLTSGAVKSDSPTT